jgi:AcrR family transcriptional regulator
MNMKQRGRPRAYDPDVALDDTMGVFWRHGFSATSLDMIAEATGMNRPSLAAAFGDKRALYLKSLARFGERMRETLGAKLARKAKIDKSLLAFYAAAIDIYRSGGSAPLGCFVITTATTESAEDPTIKKALAAVLNEIDLMLEDRIRRAIKDGQMGAEADVRGLAKLASATLHSLAVRARAGESRRALESLAAVAVRCITS